MHNCANSGTDSNSNEYWNDSTKSCEACPQWSYCKNGIITMKAIRTTTRSGGPTAEQVFKFPQTSFSKCRISVKARQTDYNSGSEYLRIQHVDHGENLHTKCGMTQQCHQDLFSCHLSKTDITVGSDKSITISGYNTPSSNYCPYDPTRDGWPSNNSPQSSQGYGACGNRGTGGHCYYMWAEVTITSCW